MVSTWEERAIILNKEREELILSEYACRTEMATRLNPEDIPDPQNIRPAFFHDTDRIIHSLAYSRYIDKTQVFFLFDNDHITHRVLHVQLVSKIARTIGRILRLNEDLIEAISLGHDIGHTPFGHDGEKYLNKICQENNIGYFRHNAQSVRFMMELEDRGKGCNLSLQVLDGILCHNGEELSEEYVPTKPKGWDDFLAEYEGCMYKPDYEKKLKPFTLEGCVVRISDVISYVGRDIEDAITVGLITREEIPEDITRVLGNTNREIVNSLVLDLVQNSQGKNCLSLTKPVLSALEVLYKFNYEKIYHAPNKAYQNEKIEQMFRQIFQALLKQFIAREDGKKERDRYMNSRMYRDFLINMRDDYLESTPAVRIVVDFIAGMTDNYFLSTYNDLFLPEGFGYRL